jgi:hypothetical protein
MRHFGEAKDQEVRTTKGKFCTRRPQACRGNKFRGDEIPPTGKGFYVILTVINGACLSMRY